MFNNDQNFTLHASYKVSGGIGRAVTWKNKRTPNLDKEFLLVGRGDGVFAFVSKGSRRVYWCVMDNTGSSTLETRFDGMAETTDEALQEATDAVVRVWISHERRAARPLALA